MKFVLFVAACLLTSVSQAAVLVKCDKNDVANIPEPINENFKSFLDGKLRFFTVDTQGEPVSGSAHAIIDIEDDSNRVCFQLSDVVEENNFNRGFSWVYANHVIMANDEEPYHLFIPVSYYPHAQVPPEYRMDMIHLVVKLDPPSVNIAK